MFVNIVNGRPEGYKTPTEYANEWHISAMSVRQYIYRNRLEALRIGDNLFLKEGLSMPEELKRGRKKS